MADELQEILEQMVNSLQGCVGAAIGDPSGLPVASAMAGRETLAATAMAALALSASKNVASNMGLTGLQDVIIEGDSWKVLVTFLVEGFSLFTVLEGEVNLGLVKLYVENVRPKLAELLERLRRG